MYVLTFTLLNHVQNRFFYFTGDIIVFEVFSKGANIQVKLKDINTYCKNPLNSNVYNLIGVVIYKGSISTRDVQTLGHYTAICYRVGTWIKYNDLLKKEKILQKNH